MSTCCSKHVEAWNKYIKKECVKLVINQNYYWFVLSVRFSACPSAHLHETNRLPLNGFSWNLIFEYFSKICREIPRLIKIWQELTVLYMKTNIHFWSHQVHFFLEWEIFRTRVVEKIKTHILCPIYFFRKPCRVWDNVENFCTAGQATDGNMVHAHCMLDT
jgi:hypothetical protein